MEKELEQMLEVYYDFWFGVNELYDCWAKKHGLTANALFVLHAIRNFHTNCTQQIICKKLLLPKQTVNSIIDMFEKKGYLSKVTFKGDKRSKLIELTSEGLIYADKVLTKMHILEKQAMQNMSAGQRKSLQENMERFLLELQKTLI